MRKHAAHVIHLAYLQDSYTKSSNWRLSAKVRLWPAASNAAAR